jgi:hypothetical protein
MDRGVPALDPLTWARRNRSHRGCERWKAPLPLFIEDLYAKRFGCERPDVVKAIEEIARAAERHRAERATRRASHT